MSITNRRKFLGRGAGQAAVAAALAAVPASAQDNAGGKPVKRVIYGKAGKPAIPPLFSPAVAFGNLLFLSGVGYHAEGDIKVHTTKVLDQIQQQLEAAGSSMSKVLKCSVFLNDLKDYAGMNEAYKGRFGDEPPVRTTIAAAGGVPGNSLVEIDVIAYI
jgi:enamine deaminase RidA (YjgF/YER057c/UK114 family)